MHDEQCTNGNIVFQPKLHLQQTLPLLCPKPYKHPKTTTLTPPKKKTMARYCAIIFFLDKEKKVTMLFFFSFFQTQRR